MALVLFTTEAGLVLLGALALFTAMTERGRAALGAIDARIVLVLLAFAVCGHIFLLERAGTVTPAFERLRDVRMAGGNTLAWLRLWVFLLWLTLAWRGWWCSRAAGRAPEPDPAPAITREPVPAIAVDLHQSTWRLCLRCSRRLLLRDRRADMPSEARRLCWCYPDWRSSSPLVTASSCIINAFSAWRGLACCWYPRFWCRSRLCLLPWATGTDLRVAQPAAAMGRFFAESFERRTGRPLAVVSGDARIGGACGTRLRQADRVCISFRTDAIAASDGTGHRREGRGDRVAGG